MRNVALLLALVSAPAVADTVTDRAAAISSYEAYKSCLSAAVLSYGLGNNQSPEVLFTRASPGCGDKLSAFTDDFLYEIDKVDGETHKSIDGLLDAAKSEAINELIDGRSKLRKHSR